MSYHISSRNSILQKTTNTPFVPSTISSILVVYMICEKKTELLHATLITANSTKLNKVKLLPLV